MTNIILDLDVTDDLAARVADLPAGTVNCYAVAALQEATDDAEEKAGGVCTEDEKRAVYASLGESCADADAGRTVSAEDVFARLQERIEARRTPVGTAPVL